MKDWLIFLVLLRCILAQEYIIQRQVALIQDSWIDQPDKVLLPRSMCTSDVTAKCKSMGGTRMNTTCGCECTDGNESTLEFSRSTFGFYENQWKCLENKKVRSHAGCKTIMNERQETIHLMTFPMTKPLIGHKIPGLSNTRNCAITGGKYLKCNGNWQQLNSKLVKSRFYLQENEYLYYSTSQPSTPTINGRVIRLEIKCTHPTTSQCVLFKVKGQMKCPLTTTTSALASSRTNNLTFTTLTRVATTPLILTDPFNHKTGERASSKHGNSGLIAGALAGAIGLSIVIVIIVVLRRRKKRYAVPKTNDRVVENEIYGLGVDTTLKFVVPGQRSQGGGKYCYATNRKNEVSQCSSSVHVQSEAHSHSHSEQPEYTIPYRGGITSQPGLDAPIYDTPVASDESRIRNDNQADQIDHRVYNVLEEPEVKSHGTEEPSCYQNLEGTFPEGAIMNGSSEGPVSSSPSLKGPGPYGNLDISRTAGEDGSSDDVIYDYNHVDEVLID